MKIVITGATGFVGSNLQEFLRISHEIEEMTIRHVSNQNFELLGDVLIHLAGLTKDIIKVLIPQVYYEANFEFTKQLFDRFLISEASIFIFTSTVKAVADEVQVELMEEHEPNPITHYGKSKLLAEQYILSKEIPVGKRVYILRPCMIHGPGNKGNLNLLYSLVSKRIPWPLGAFENKRSYCSIDNLLFIIKELIEREDIPSGVYNVADDEPLSTNDLIGVLAETQHRKPLIWNIPKPIVQFVAKLGNTLKLPLNEERLQKLTGSYVVSNKKLMNAIGKPLPVSSKAGLIKTFQSFQ
jgi:nucleoside-diphosphate-sugar epimerase